MTSRCVWDGVAGRKKCDRETPVDGGGVLMGEGAVYREQPFSGGKTWFLTWTGETTGSHPTSAFDKDQPVSVGRTHVGSTVRFVRVRS